eukprot:tig00020796_g13719.t3
MATPLAGRSGSHLLLDARAAWAAGTQRRTISRLRLRARAGAPGVQRRAMSRLVALLAVPSRRGRPGRSGGPSIASAQISTHDARAAGAAGTQRRPISCLATQLAAPSIRVRAVAAGVQRRPMSRLVARLTESRRLRGGRGPDAAGR